jgi:hypothetical protein
MDLFKRSGISSSSAVEGSKSTTYTSRCRNPFLRASHIVNGALASGFEVGQGQSLAVANTPTKERGKLAIFIPSPAAPHRFWDLLMAHC